MNYVFAILLIGFGSVPALACVDLSGTYAGKTSFVRFEQKGCERITQWRCAANGTDCTGDSFTWPLNGDVITSGSPATWGGFSIVGQTLVFDCKTLGCGFTSGASCQVVKRTYAKNSRNGLDITYHFWCYKGHTKADETHVWNRVK